MNERVGDCPGCVAAIKDNSLNCECCTKSMCISCVLCDALLVCRRNVWSYYRKGRQLTDEERAAFRLAGVIPETVSP